MVSGNTYLSGVVIINQGELQASLGAVISEAQPIFNSRGHMFIFAGFNKASLETCKPQIQPAVKYSPCENKEICLIRGLARVLLVAECEDEAYMLSLPPPVNFLLILLSLSTSSFSTSSQLSTSAVEKLVSSWCSSVESRMRPWRSAWHYSEYLPFFSATSSSDTVRWLSLCTYITCSLSNTFYFGLPTFAVSHWH